jgi:DNA ligase-1
MSFTLGPIFNTQGNKVRTWSIAIELHDANGGVVAIKETPSETVVTEGFFATYSTISGYSGMKMTESARTTVHVGKNLGKKNETNVLTQAIRECASKHSAKLKAGYTDTVAQTSTDTVAQTSTDTVAQTSTDTVAQTSTDTVGRVPFPMAVKSWKDHKSKLSYPLYVEPKLDGIRMIAQWVDGDVKLFTRRLHPITGFTKIKNELRGMFIMSGEKSFIIDGELYSHGMNLQTISGIVRSESIPESEKEVLKYHVFDCFDVSNKSLGYTARTGILCDIVCWIRPSQVILLRGSYVKTPELADQYYTRVTAEGYEGIIYKSYDAPYEFDFNKEKRSSWYLKRKKQEDSEFPISGYAQGKGKDIGCIVFELVCPGGKVFNSVPNGSYDYRRQLYTEACKSFDTSFKNKLAKVVYDDLSKDGVPLRGRIVQIGRDTQFD